MNWLVVVGNIGAMNVRPPRGARMRRIWGAATTAMTMTLAACGDAGGNTASGGATDGGTSTGASTGSAAASVTEGSNSMSDSATESTAGSNSLSDSQASMTAPTGSDSLSDSATVSTTDSASATDSTSGTTGAMSGTGDTGDSTVGSSSSSSTGGEPLVCGDAPPGFDGNDNPDCSIAPQVGAFDPVLEWSKSSWATAQTYNQVMMTPIVATITDDDGDGVYGSDGDMPSVLLMTYAGASWDSTGVLRALSGDGKQELLTISNQNLGALSGIAVGDLDGDAKPEIVAVQYIGAVKVFGHDGALKWTSAAYPGDITYSNMAAPAIADLDGDSKPEVIVGRVILNSDGSLRGKGMYGTGAPKFGSASFAADLDGDGQLEVVVGNAAYHADGSHLWSIPYPDGYPAVANFDGVPGPEIVVSGGSTVRLQTGAGVVLWSVNNPTGLGGPPTIADFDGDGEPEIGVAGSTGYVVFDTDGKVLWTKKTQDATSGTTGSSVYDFEGDGVADVVYADETDLYVFSGVDGTVKLKYSEHASGTALEYPVVADLDNDGQVELVVVHNALLGGQNGISVLGDASKSWRPGRKIWNQHAYSITNVNDDGTIPAMPIPNDTVYNSFRSGDLSPPDGTKTPDLTLDVPELCTFECVDDKLVLWVHVGNQGASPLTAGATVEVHGLVLGVDTTLATTNLVDIINPGEYLGALAYEIDPTDLASLTITVATQEQECNVDNNKVEIQGPFCKM